MVCIDIVDALPELYYSVSIPISPYLSGCVLVSEICPLPVLIYCPFCGVFPVVEGLNVVGSIVCCFIDLCNLPALLVFEHLVVWCRM